MPNLTVPTPYPLTPMQQGILLSSTHLPVPGADIEQIHGQLSESVATDKFRTAWQWVINKHSVLRNAFKYTDQEQPVQFVHDQVDHPFSFQHLSHVAEPKTYVTHYLYEDRQGGFDLTQPPLSRVALFQFGDSRYDFVWTFHHIILDGRSQRTVLEDVFNCYQTLCDGNTPEESKSSSYKLFVDWCQAQEPNESQNFWQQHLDGITSSTSLPVDQPLSRQAHPLSALPATGPFIGRAEQLIQLSAEATRKVSEAAAAHDLTVNTFVQGAWALLLSRHSGEDDIVFGALRAGRHGSIEEAKEMVGLFINTLPIRVKIDLTKTVLTYLRGLRHQQISLRPHEQTPLVNVQQWSKVPPGQSLFDSILIFDNYLLDSSLKAKGGAWANRSFTLYEQTIYPLALYGYGGDELQLKLNYDGRLFTDGKAEQLLGHLEKLLTEMGDRLNEPLAAIDLLTVKERQQLLDGWNQTSIDYPTESCVHHLFEAQVEKTPQAIALVFNGTSLSYGDLNDLANQMAHRLLQEGVAPDTFVGIYMDRSLAMMVALLGTLKAGGAYLPLDPAYPLDRLNFMIEDAKVPVIITDQHYAALLSRHSATVLVLDSNWALVAEQPASPVLSNVKPQNLSYLIYTSGSTGKPKGVMVEHRNAVNFFAGMDKRIPHGAGGSGSSVSPNESSKDDVWLAVTSLSFDISVLELFWTLARGFKVVLYSDSAGKTGNAQSTQADDDRPPRNANAAQNQSPPKRSIDFSLFYFASDESERGAIGKYQLLMEGAKFADKNGFSSIWTPERHFHAFGGLYPNPSVISAAIAATTTDLQIRAGSCVLPLHSPIRVAEEWAIVDNLSQGRVGISFAAGWQPDDFALRPENHQDRKNIMMQDIETVRRLWRGESIPFPGPNGKDVDVSTLPRPVQKELPVWITAAGNPETFRSAGAGGFNILTHLLGQTVEELGEKIAVYRQARAEAGFTQPGHVTIMLHTFIGDDMETVRETVREPMKAYLRSSVELVKAAAWSFPALRQKADASGRSPMELLESEELAQEDMDALLNFAFERYFETSGLFGTPESAMAMVAGLSNIGVNEIACLIDFGVPSEQVLEHLQPLNQLRAAAQQPLQTEPVLPDVPAQREEVAMSISESILAHNVTHFQCTPSQMTMLLLEKDAAESVSTLSVCMLGGEAMPVALAHRLDEVLTGDLINMYGPTETTIWSSTCAIEGKPNAISVGRPIANTQLYIVDEALNPVPVGVAGELLIGGDGVVRGYLERPELTEERFIANPFIEDSSARVYRTGDLARYRPDGYVDFLGRSDFQVKIRGHRIELGEIEVAMSRHAAVREAVVIARADATGSQRMIGYMLLQPGVDVPDSKAMRAHLGDSLPDFMIPSLFVALEHFPQTPNGKVDRNALPEPSEVASTSSAGFIPPRTPFEEELALLWANVLDAERIGATENFFELGGHSLSAVQVAFRIRRDFGIDLPLQTFFDKPTLGEMADELQQQLFASADAEELDTMLDALDGLSEAEIDELLASTKPAETNSPTKELAAQTASPFNQVTSSPA